MWGRLAASPQRRCGAPSYCALPDLISLDIGRTGAGPCVTPLDTACSVPGRDQGLNLPYRGLIKPVSSMPPVRRTLVARTRRRGVVKGIHVLYEPEPRNLSSPYQLKRRRPLAAEERFITTGDSVCNVGCQ